MLQIHVEFKIFHSKINPNNFTKNYEKFLNATIKLYNTDKENDSIFGEKIGHIHESLLVEPRFIWL